MDFVLRISNLMDFEWHLSRFPTHFEYIANELPNRIRICLRDLRNIYEMIAWLWLSKKLVRSIFNVLPMDFKGFWMYFKRISHGFSIDVKWISNGEPMDFKMISNMFSMNFKWISNEFEMDVQRISDEFKMACR